MSKIGPVSLSDIATLGIVAGGFLILKNIQDKGLSWNILDVPIVSVGAQNTQTTPNNDKNTDRQFWDAPAWSWAFGPIGPLTWGFFN